LVRFCSIDGCKNKHIGKGYCGKHYQKFRRYGNPLYIPDAKEISKKLSRALKGKKRSDATRKRMSESSKRENLSDATLKRMSESHSTPERKAQQREILKKSRKNMARPNIPEKAIGKILEEIGITVKFLQYIDYETVENKLASKEMDIVGKDSMGNKKIIEYNGRYHFDNRNHKPDEIHQVHGKPIVVKDLWANEEMILNQIRKAGYQILIVWEKDFLHDFENVKTKILKFVKKR